MIFDSMGKTILILAIAAAFVAGTITTTGMVYAHGGDVTLIHACVGKTLGIPRIVSPTTTCTRFENPLDWSIQGVQGIQGNPGQNGQACWDLNNNGAEDVATEDANGDTFVNVADCKGEQGIQGEQGEPGTGGTTGIDCTNLNPGAILTECVLHLMDLSGKSFVGANLVDADLGGSDLTGAFFRGANLKGALLDEATLINANFQFADLSGAVLERSNLNGADFNGADLTNLLFSGCTGTPLGTPALGILPTCS
jgi:hypothetical protein